MKMLSAVVLVALLTAACGSSSGTSGSADATHTVAVVATDSSCTPDKTDLPAGKTTFTVKNDGDTVTELYVYGPEDRIISEVENVGPGTSRKLTADLKAGSYELACKPGQTGKGIRAAITVAGAGGTQGGTQAAASRKVDVGATEFKFTDIDGLTAKAGETVGFELHNNGTIPHEFEVLGPDGKAIGEVEPVDAGKTGEAKITFGGAGTYQYVCGIEGHEAAGMKGILTVS